MQPFSHCFLKPNCYLGSTNAQQNFRQAHLLSNTNAQRFGFFERVGVWGRLPFPHVARPKARHVSQAKRPLISLERQRIFANGRYPMLLRTRGIFLVWIYCLEAFRMRGSQRIAGIDLKNYTPPADNILTHFSQIVNSCQQKNLSFLKIFTFLPNMYVSKCEKLQILQ